MTTQPHDPASSPPPTLSHASPEPGGPAGRRPRVALVFGGRSSEHSVSCATAAGVLSAIDREAFDVVPIGVTKDGRWVAVEADLDALALTAGHTPEVQPAQAEVVLPLNTRSRELSSVQAGVAPASLGEIDVVFPLLHGPFGEDGTVQGLLDLADIPYVGSGVLASALMMDKHHMKVAFAGAGLPVGPYEVVTDRDWLRDPEAACARVSRLGFPLFVKPARAGSSVGISRVVDAAGLTAAIEAAREHDPKVVVEAAIFGREIECGVLGGRGIEPNRASELGEIAVSGGGHQFYDFEAKYLDETDVQLSCPADLPADVTTRMREMAVEAFEAAGCEGLARVDFFYTTDGDIVLNEINTMPGFTPTSMYPMLWAATGVTYPELITELLELALHRRVGLR